MGVAISSPVKTSPFSLATGIIGLVSFIFTLGTFFRVVWVNMETMGEASHEVHSYLTNIRTELLEERASLKKIRKGMRKHRKHLKRGDDGGSPYGLELDEITLKTMSDTVRQLCKKFSEVEKPFLAEGELGIGAEARHGSRARRRNSSVSPPRYAHAAYSSPPEKDSRYRARSNHDRDHQEEEEDAFWAQRCHYADFTLGRRFKWLTKKPKAQSLFETLSRVQIRRIALQVGGMAILMHEYGQGTLELNDAVQRIDERVSRVVGVRRVE